MQPTPNTDMTKNEAPVVLIVDDEEGIREECAETLRSYGIPCTIAPGPDEALRILLANRSILVVLSDIRMPGRNGFDLLDQVRLFCDGKFAVEVILMSGYVSSLLSDRPARLQAAAILPKPAHAERLYKIVLEVAAKAANRRAVV